MLKKVRLAAVLLILILAASTGCGTMQSDIEPFNVEIVGGEEYSFNITIDDFIEQFNKLYEKDHGEEYLTSFNGECQYTFSEDDTIWVLPRLRLATAENGYISMAGFSFDWHSYTEALLEKYKMMCTYAFKIFLPEISDEDIDELCNRIIEDGYNNPVSRENENPSAVYYRGNIGIGTRCAIGCSQVISVIPVTEEILNEYGAEGVRIVEIGD